jgi:hypothetical protein
MADRRCRRREWPWSVVDSPPNRPQRRAVYHLVRAAAGGVGPARAEPPENAGRGDIAEGIGQPPYE